MFNLPRQRTDAKPLLIAVAFCRPLFAMSGRVSAEPIKK